MSLSRSGRTAPDGGSFYFEVAPMPTFNHYSVADIQAIPSGTRDALGAGFGLPAGSVTDLLALNSGEASAEGLPNGSAWALDTLGAASIGAAFVDFGPAAGILDDGAYAIRPRLTLLATGDTPTSTDGLEIGLLIMNAAGTGAVATASWSTDGLTPTIPTDGGTFEVDFEGSGGTDLLAELPVIAALPGFNHVYGILVVRGVGHAPGYTPHLDSLELVSEAPDPGGTMTDIAIQVRLPWDMIDVRGPMSSNTWHFTKGGPAPDEGALDDTVTQLLALYSDGLDGIWSSVLSGAIEVSAYDLSDPKPRVPFGMWTGSLTPGADTLPGEVTLKVGYRAPRVTGVHVQARRGTLHLGPLNTSVIGTDGRITDAVMDQVEAAFNTWQGTFAATGIPQVVGSEANGFFELERFALSNECGTVRRRQFRMTDRRLVAV